MDCDWCSDSCSRLALATVTLPEVAPLELDVVPPFLVAVVAVEVVPDFAPEALDADAEVLDPPPELLEVEAVVAVEVEPALPPAELPAASEVFPEVPDPPAAAGSAGMVEVEVAPAPAPAAEPAEA